MLDISFICDGFVFTVVMLANFIKFCEVLALVFAKKVSNYMLFHIHASVLTCCFAPCGWLLASGDSGGEIIIWDIHAGNHLYCKTAHDMGVNCILFSTKWDPSQGQHTMISAGSDCMLYIWNITTYASK